MPSKTTIVTMPDSKRSLMEAIIESSPEGVVVADKQGNIVYANPSYNRINGIDAKERMGMNVLTTNPAGALANALRSRQPVLGNRHRPPGSRGEVVAHAFPIMVEGDIIGAAAFFREAGQAVEILNLLAKTQEYADVLANKIEGMGRAPYTFDSIIGNNEKLLKAISMARRAAPTNSTVLLRGESGTGKELLAAAIHNESRRYSCPFIHVNCAAIPETLLESEFFGYEKGAFTGADRRKLGTFELADRGTIFLDEISDMDQRLQAKLLLVLQNGQFRRLGGVDNITVDVRVIAATNRDLEEMVVRSKFREDLYFRLNVVEIRLPPLRERTDDIPLLVDHLLRKISRRIGKASAGVDRRALHMLEKYCWPGNVRELENVLERGLTLSEGGKPLTECDLVLPTHRLGERQEIRSLADMERHMIKEALSRYGRTVQGKTQAAETLGISLTTLYNKIKKLGIEI